MSNATEGWARVIELDQDINRAHTIFNKTKDKEVKAAIKRLLVLLKALHKEARDKVS